MKTTFFKLFWVLLLMISSFTLGYTLKPKTSKRSMPPAMMRQAMGGSTFRMPSGRVAPPLNFQRR